MKLTDIESGIEFNFDINDMYSMLRVKKTGCGECTEVRTKLTNLCFYVKETPAEIYLQAKKECIK